MRITLVGSRHFGVTTLNMLREHKVEVVRVVGGRVRERTRERRRARLEDVVQRPAGQVVLIEGEDGGAPLLRPTHATCTSPSACRP